MCAGAEPAIVPVPLSVTAALPWPGFGVGGRTSGGGDVDGAGISG